MTRERMSSRLHPPGPVLSRRALGRALAATASSPFVLRCARHDAKPLLVYAASSLELAFAELRIRYDRGNAGPTLRANFAGSNTLALQLEAAPIADLFLSANPRWMQRLSRAGLIEEQTAFCGNRLVVVAPNTAPRRGSNFQLTELARAKRWFAADPKAVPAGQYTQAALEQLPGPNSTNLWAASQRGLVPTASVRDALHAVERSTDTLGVVYRSDARTSKDVQILAELATPAPIQYVAGLLVASAQPEAARRFVALLTSQPGQAILSRFGFESNSERLAAPAGTGSGTPAP